MKDKSDRARRERGRGVTPVTNGRGRRRANEEIADDASGERSRERKHHHAEKIESGADGGRCAFDGEDECSAEVSDAHEARRANGERGLRLRVGHGIAIIMRANGVGMMKDYKAWAPMRGVMEICLVRGARRIPVELFLALLRPN